MLRQLKIMFLISSVVIISPSCTKFVWENRGECPCILTLDLSNVDKGIDTLHLWIFSADDDILFRDTIGSEKFSSTYEVLIKRDMVKYFLWGNIKEATALKDNLSLNSTLSKLDNLSADSLYHYSKLLNTNFENTCDTVLLNKEFITVDVLLKGHVHTGNNIRIELFGNSTGFYVDKRFIGGIGKVTSLPYYRDDYKTLFTYRITRQEYLPDITMVLITTHNGIPTILSSIPIGKWLSENGYDMQSKNLSDIKMELDLSVNFITIITDDWRVTIPVNVDF